MSYPFIPEGLFPITIGPAALGNTAVTEWINVSEANMAWIVVQTTIAAATATVVTPAKSPDAAGAGTAVLGYNAPIWYGTAAAGAAITLERQTDAANFTTTAVAGVHIVIFQIDPAHLGTAGAALGDYQYITCASVGLVADYQTVTAWVKPRYQQEEQSSAAWII